MGEKIWRLLDNYFCGNYLDVNDHSIDYYYTIEGHSCMNVIKRIGYDASARAECCKRLGAH